MTPWIVAKGIFLFLGILAGLYVLVVLLIIPAFMNAFNGFGYFYNALWCLGLKDYAELREERRCLRSEDPYKRQSGEMRRSLRLQREYIKKHGHNNIDLILGRGR